jgi:hypothetical protein
MCGKVKKNPHSCRHGGTQGLFRKTLNAQAFLAFTLTYLSMDQTLLCFVCFKYGLPQLFYELQKGEMA